MAIFDEIRTGLQEAIAYEKGNARARTCTISICPVEEFSASEIRDIRRNAEMTQAMFAKYMGVSLKTVEAWEAGRNQPGGAACRMLSLTRRDPQFPKTSGIVRG